MEKSNQSEKSIEFLFNKTVYKYNWLSYKLVSPGNTGVPDRLVLTDNGKVAFAEIKTMQGRLSPRQELTIDTLRARGFVVGVIRSPEDIASFIVEVCRGL